MSYMNGTLRLESPIFFHCSTGLAAALVLELTGREQGQVVGSIEDCMDGCSTRGADSLRDSPHHPPRGPAFQVFRCSSDGPLQRRILWKEVKGSALVHRNRSFCFRRILLPSLPCARVSGTRH